MTRAELHKALDALLGFADKTEKEDADGAAFLGVLLDANDETETETGDVDAAAFWHFVAGLARGRGIAEEIEIDAVLFMTHHGVVLDPADPEPFWRAYQFAVLFKVLRRLQAAGGGILPESFSAIAFEAVAQNAVRGKPQLPDLLDLGTGGGFVLSMQRAAQAVLVSAVLYRQALDGVSEKEAMARVLPSGRGRPAGHDRDGFDRTWRDWKANAAKFYDIPKDRLKDKPTAAARGNIDAKTYTPDQQQVKELWGWACRQPPTGCKT